MKVGVENLKVCIKETKDIVESLGVVFEDGKISLADLVKVPALFRATNSLVKAAQAVAPEIKDIDAAEAQELVSELIPLVALIASKFGFKVA